MGLNLEKDPQDNPKIAPRDPQKIPMSWGSGLFNQEF